MEDSSNSSADSPYSPAAEAQPRLRLTASQTHCNSPTRYPLTSVRGARLFIDMPRLSCRDPDLWRTVARCYGAGIRFDTHLKINRLFACIAHLLVTHDLMRISSNRQRNASTEQTLCCLRGGVIYVSHTGMPSSLYVTKFQSPALQKDGWSFQFRPMWKRPMCR